MKCAGGDQRETNRLHRDSRISLDQRRAVPSERARATALQTNRGAVQRLSGGAGRCKKSTCISGNMNKYFVNHKSAEVLDVMTSTMHGSDKVLTNPAFTTLHRTKACMNLSPGVSPLGATGPGCLGIQAGGASPPSQGTWDPDYLSWGSALPSTDSVTLGVYPLGLRVSSSVRRS